MDKNYTVRFDYKPIYNVENFKSTWQQSADIQKSTEKKEEQTNQRGAELQEVSFTSIITNAMPGYEKEVNVRKEVEEWKKKLHAVSYLDFNGALWGPILQLRKVEVTDVKFAPNGVWVYAKINFAFKEYDPETTAVKRDTSGIWTGPSSAVKDTLAGDKLKGEISNLKVGDYVKPIGSSYTNGASIPKWVKDMKHYVSQINVAQDKVLLGANGGICSWVKLSEVTLA